MTHHEHLFVEKAVKRTEDWRWGSLWARRHDGPELKALLSDWPVDRPRNWAKRVNEPMTARELAAIQTSITRNRPFGSEAWQRKTATRLGLLHTLRSEGRPKKQAKGAAEGGN
jgi:putative transposase